jgi:outer membrane receptor protein involved in Fe transport
VARRRRQFIVVGAAVLFAVRAADAADLTVMFRIPREGLGAALIDLAVQADISISTQAMAACHGRDDALVGRFTVRDALEKRLDGSGCGFRQLNPRAFEILANPATAPKRHPTQSASVALDEVDPVVVVATRRAARESHLAYPVSTAGERILVSQGIEDLGDLARITPSMTVTNLGLGRDKILLRGLSDGPLTGRIQSMVGLYLDDVRLTFDAPDPDLRMVDIEKVEVLRGPQGALYGAGSLGGVVQMLTTPPDPSKVSAWVAATGAATVGGSNSGAVDAVFNTPLAGGRGAARAVLYREVQGGYIRDSLLGVGHANATGRDGGRLSLVFDLNDSWTVSGGGALQVINSADTQYADPGLAAYARNVQVREPHDNDFAEYHLGLQGDLGWGVAKLSAAYIRHSLFSRYDASRGAPLTAPPAPAAYDEQNNVGALVAEATLSSRPAGQGAWLAGLFYSHADETVSASLTALRNPVTLLHRSNRLDRLDEAAVFGEASLSLTERLKLTLGGRLFASRDAVFGALPSDPTGVPVAGVAAQLGFAPKAVLSFQAGEQALFYLQAAEGYRGNGLNTAGLPQASIAGSGPFVPPRRYTSDELWSVEAGGRVSLDDERVSLRFAAFEAFWTNIQSDQLSPAGLPFTANIGDGRNIGLEFEGSYRLGGLQLGGDFLVNEPELARANTGFPALADINLAVSPDLQFGASASRVWRLSEDRSLELDGRWAYFGRSRLALGAAATPPMGDYSTARLAATLESSRWRMTMAVENPANARGNTFAYGNPFSLRTVGQVTPLRPTTVSLTLRIAY